MIVHVTCPKCGERFLAATAECPMCGHAVGEFTIERSPVVFRPGDMTPTGKLWLFRIGAILLGTLVGLLALVLSIILG